MNEPTPSSIPIRDFEEAVYIFWYGPELPAVKIGHTNLPERRLAELRNDTGVPAHLASYAAIVWLDRTREKVEAKAHELAADFRRDGEWFELAAADALNFVEAAARQLGVRYEIEDRASLRPEINEISKCSDQSEQSKKWEDRRAYERSFMSRREGLVDEERLRAQYLKQKWRANDGSLCAQHDHPPKPIWMWYRPAMGDSKNNKKN